MTTADVLLAALGAVALGAGLLVVTTRHVVRAGLWLVVTLGAVAGLYLVLSAELLAWIQVLLYVGAVVVLLLFAVMLTRAPIGASDDLDRVRWPGALVGPAPPPAWWRCSPTRSTGAGSGLPAPGTAEAIGGAVFRTWVLPFELVSVLLLAALVGAIVVSRPDVSAGGRPGSDPGSESLMHPVLPFTIAALLFGIGVYGVIVRRNAVLLLMAVELLLNAVNLVLVTADATIRSLRAAQRAVVHPVHHRARRRRDRRRPRPDPPALPAAPLRRRRGAAAHRVRS